MTGLPIFLSTQKFILQGIYNLTILRSINIILGIALVTNLTFYAEQKMHDSYPQAPYRPSQCGNTFE